MSRSRRGCPRVGTPGAGGERGLAWWLAAGYLGLLGLAWADDAPPVFPAAVGPAADSAVGGAPGERTAEAGVGFKPYTLNGGKPASSDEDRPNMDYALLWPESGASPDALAALRQGVRELFCADHDWTRVPPDDPTAILRDLAGMFDRAAQADTMMGPAHRDRRRMRLRFQAGRVVSLALDTEEFLGGNHGLTTLRYAVFDTQTGQRLRLAEVFREDARGRLAERIEAAIRTQRGLPEGASLRAAGFFEDTIEPTENFLLERQTIRFRFDPYDIAPYCQGPTDVTLPYTALADLLRADSPAAALWTPHP